MNEGLEISAILYKVQSTVDGGWRVTFDMHGNDTQKVFTLALLKDTLLRLTVVQSQANSLVTSDPAQMDINDYLTSPYAESYSVPKVSRD